MLTSNVGEAYGFVRSRPELDLPDLELIFAPAPFLRRGPAGEPPGHGVVFGPILRRTRKAAARSRCGPPTRTPSRSSTRGTSPIPAASDRAAMMSGLRMCARIAAAPALKGLLGTHRATARRARHWTTPPSRRRSTPARTPCITRSAPAGWAATTPAWSIPQLRVRGVDGLRVADASVMPSDRSRTHPRAVGADRGEGRRSDPRLTLATRTSSAALAVRIRGILANTASRQNGPWRGNTDDDERQTSPGARRSWPRLPGVRSVRRPVSPGSAEEFDLLLRARRPQVRTPAGDHPRRSGSGVGAVVQGVAPPRRRRRPRRHHDRAPRAWAVAPRRLRRRPAAEAPSP